jgi:hypothetical protein
VHSPRCASPRSLSRFVTLLLVNETERTCANIDNSDIDAQLDVFDTIDLDIGTFAVPEGMYFQEFQ